MSQVDIEDAKTLECGKLQAALQENGKLQATLQQIQQKFDKTKALLVKECEAAKTKVEGAPTIRDVSAVDNELMDKLRDENEKLKALVQSLEKKVDEIEKFEETSMISDERLKMAMEAG